MGMMLAGFLFLLLLTGGKTSSSDQPGLLTPTPGTEQGWNTSGPEQLELSVGFRNTTGGNATSEPEGDYETDTTENKHSYLDVFNYLKLDDSHSMIRPVRGHKSPTMVYIKMVLYAILDVRESDQTFIPYVWIFLEWKNDLIRWNKSHFSGIDHIIVPANLLWKPDITIKEMTEKAKTPPSPYIRINHDGWVEFRNDQVLISTCGMNVYKFPFDTQKCKLSFRSILHSSEEIFFYGNRDTEKNMDWNREVMDSHSEWRLIDVNVEIVEVNNFGMEQSMMVYTYSMKRRPVLYIVSFILPILFFLWLDFASFLISDSSGEKLSFKITVLLAITVLQLILNEILPSSSDRIPLIAVYCIGVFAMMLLSLLETIVVMYLLAQESSDKAQSPSEDGVDSRGKNKVKRRWNFCVCHDGEPPTLELPDKEGSSSQLTEMTCTAEKMTSDDSRSAAKAISLFSISSRKEGRKPGYWIRVTKRINKVFFIFYITTTTLFLILIFSLWYTAEDE